METSISMKTTAQDGTKNTTTLSYVNPNASDANLKLYAQKLASLTSDTYTGSTKIEKTSLDDVPAKVPRNMQLAKFVDGGATVTVEASLSNADAGDSFMVVYAGTGEPKFQWENDGGNFCTSVIMFNDSFKAQPTEDFGEGMWAGGNGHITVTVDANDVYDEGELIITISGGEG